MSCECLLLPEPALQQQPHAQQHNLYDQADTAVTVEQAQMVFSSAIPYQAPLGLARSILKHANILLTVVIISFPLTSFEPEAHHA